jgi:hypothetical protein
MPTIAELVGGAAPNEIHGSSLVPVLTGEYAPTAEYTIAEGDFCTSLNTEQWKLMHVDSSDAYRLFDLTVDPLGLDDVSDRYPGKFAELKAIVDEYLRIVEGRREENTRPMSEETVRQLKALGYL